MVWNVPPAISQSPTGRSQLGGSGRFPHNPGMEDIDHVPSAEKNLPKNLQNLYQLLIQRGAVKSIEPYFEIDVQSLPESTRDWVKSFQSGYPSDQFDSVFSPNSCDASIPEVGKWLTEAPDEPIAKELQRVIQKYRTKILVRKHAWTAFVLTAGAAIGIGIIAAINTFGLLSVGLVILFIAVGNFAAAGAKSHR